MAKKAGKSVKKSKAKGQASMDQRVKLDMDPEDALRVLLNTPKKRGAR